MLHKLGLIPFFLLIFSIKNVYAQPNSDTIKRQQRDTLSINISQAEDLFLKQNLELIIHRFNIDIAKAEIITARLFDNPEFSIEHAFYNAESKKIFDVNYEGGQYVASISQLFLTAGKRNKNIQLAKLGVQQAEYQFYDLLRTLKYTLRTDFYTLYYLQQSVRVYDDEIKSLERITRIFQEQYAKGNIAEKELIRVKSQLYSLKSEQNDLQQEIENVLSEIKMLIRADARSYILPQVNFNTGTHVIQEKFTYQHLIDSAYQNRYDLKAAKSQVNYSEMNLQLQKALAVPDVTVAFNFDKQANYIKNYNGLQLSMPLPFLNRNQGNIKQAKIAIDADKTSVLNVQQQIAIEVASGYESALRLEKLYNSFDPRFKDDFNHLIGEVIKNYEKRNISLLEFLDFYDSYKENSVQLNNILLQKIQALEHLNFVTGTAFFNL